MLAQAWRSGASQADLARLLRLCNIEEMDEEQARDVGGSAVVSDTNDVVVTSDPKHIKGIAGALRGKMCVELV